MGKQMLTEADWRRNVGTAAHAVSFLHEYAVGLLWDMLRQHTLNRGPFQSSGSSGSVVVKTISGDMSNNLLEGVHHVIIPDSLQNIGGYIPDIALLDNDLRPIRVVEVVVTSPCTPEKVDMLQKRGVEVVQVPVRNEEELRALFPQPFANGITWWTKIHTDSTYVSVTDSAYIRQYKRKQSGADKTVGEFMDAIRCASPEVRRQLAEMLDGLGSLESLYPLQPDNPKRQPAQSGKG